MDETELKIEHPTPELKIIEKSPEPTAPTPEPVTAPTPEPIIPAPSIDPQAPISETLQLAQELPQEPPQEVSEETPKKKSSKLSIILTCAISGAVLVAGIIAIFVVLSGKAAPTPTATTTTTEVPTANDAEIEKEDMQIIEDIKAMAVALAQFQNNNDGKVPGNWDTFYRKYAPELGKKYTYKTCDFYADSECINISDLTWAEHKYTVIIASNSSCRKNYLVKQEYGIRRLTFYTVLQAKHGERPAYVCASNEAWKNPND